MSLRPVSLRLVHDFELALVEPCMAMTRRGIRVDHIQRGERVKALEAELEALGKVINTSASEAIANFPERVPDAKRHLFVDKWTCPCCRGGSKKSQACWSCAGLTKAPPKGTPLPPCGRCEGNPRRESFAFNPGSDEQVCILLYKVLRLPKRYNDGKLSASEEKLRSIQQFDESGLVTQMVTYRKHKSILQQYNRLETAEDGRLRTFYNPAGTETGRLSSSGGVPFPAAGERFALEISTNTQNIPSKMGGLHPLYKVRECLVPEDGYVLMYADLSQAEARVVGVLSEDAELMDRWDVEGFDVHTWTIANILGKDVKHVTKEERSQGKVARHALNYGMSYREFIRTVNKDTHITGIQLDDLAGEKLYTGYHALHPNLQDIWWKRVADKLAREGRITTVLGRSRSFFGRDRGKWLGQTHKEAIAFEPQSTIADLLNLGLLNVWRELDDGENVKLIGQIHDAILLEVKESQAQAVANDVRRLLSLALPYQWRELRVPVDVEYSNLYWGG